ncbi:MAG: pectate lyase [Cyclobacteriaceae bacterium]|nr:MAG: pectate lyase [Cyclobacteriaceae bacterium]
MHLVAFLLLSVLMACNNGSGAQPCDEVVEQSELLAFPGAQGFGAKTVGGRGGRILYVTNLNDSGPGSFREACEAEGPRLVIFNTGGNILLDSHIRIANPYITIAGQTAPGGGITFSGGTVIISTSEVILRGIRVRVGTGKKGDIDGIALLSPEGNPVRNIIVDHCSISWSIDENVSTNGRKSNLSRVTFSNNIISEGLNDPEKHSKGIPHSAGMLLNKSGVDSVSVIKNLFAHNKFRQPKVGMGVYAEIINNVIYNWETKSTTIAPNAKVNIISNRYIAGPNWNGKFKGVLIANESLYEDLGQVYLKDNLGPGRESISTNEWEVASGPLNWKVDTMVFNIGTEYEPVDSTLNLVLRHCGAWPRDYHDLRVVTDVINGTGTIPSSELEVGGLLELDEGVSPTDTDGDGLPDEWERMNGFNVESKDSVMSDQNCNGYPDIEDYLNSLLPTS